MVTYYLVMDAVFRALADPTRRSLLDELYAEDGQTLSALERRFPMTRIGVMKHLRVLEEAGLVTTKRRGREKLHFLNAVPIRLVHDRWVSKYAEPWAAALSGLKTRLEEDDGEGVRDLHQDDAGAPVGGDHRSRAPRAVHVRRRRPLGLDARLPLRGRASAGTARSPRARTSRSIRPAASCRASTRCGARTCKARARRGSPGRSSRSADSCRLVVTHDQLRDGANDQLYGGWPMILSGLKTLLETGETLTTPGSLLYAQPAA